MGAGKSTVGKKVAKMLDRRFVDADVELESRTGRSVADWFARAGESGFREAESELLGDLLAGDEPLVVGAGGGVVLKKANRRRLLRPDVTVVYLHGEPGFLATRAARKPHRPLLAEREPGELFEEMYATRDALYREVADVVVEVAPHHAEGERPKWRMAETVVEALVARGEADATTTRQEAR